MKNYFLSVVAVFILAGATAQKTFVNDANAELRAVTGGFNAIKVSGGIDLYLSQYETESVAISASNEKHRQNIKTVVEDNTLKIYYEGEKPWNPGDRNMKAYVSFKSLVALHASGSCDIQVSGTISGSSLVLDLSGSSDFRGDVKLTELMLELSGASDVRISGSATTVSIQSSGASDVKGYDLVADICTAKASGASDINITVNKEINAHATGASDIFYRGDAVLKDTHTSGASSVSRKG